MANFRFDKDEHKYYLDDVRLPSVTEIIKPIYGDQSFFTYDGMKRGHIVHEEINRWLKCYTITEYSVTGEPIPIKKHNPNYKEDFANSVPSKDLHLIRDNLSRIQGFVDWFKKFSKIPLFSEKPFYHDKLMFAGTPDLVFDEYIIDIKTRKVNRPVDSLQLAGYDLLLQRNFGSFPVRRLCVLEIDPFGNTNLVELKEKQAHRMFRRLLDHHKESSEINNLIRIWKEK